MMDSPGPMAAFRDRIGPRQPRNPSSAVELSAVILVGFGVVTLGNAAVGIGAEIGLTGAGFLRGYSLATLGFTGGLRLAAAALAVGTLDLIAALGVHRVREWAYWIGIALLALHGVLGLFANPLFTFIGLLAGITLGVQKRTFTRSFE